MTIYRGFPLIVIHDDNMKKYIDRAREEIATYSVVGNEPLIDLQHLLACIIGSKATPELCGLLAKDGLRGLIGLSTYDLENIGLTHNEALRLHSSLVLAKKLNSVAPERRKTIYSPDDAGHYLMEEMRFLKQEHFVALFLNTKNQVIKKQTIFVGDLDSSYANPRELFNIALKQDGCASIIVYHNHPSGCPLNIVS